jgi:hypothetical protein
MCRSILSYRPEAGARALRHVFREDLLARVADDGEAVSRYRAALADIALRGAGSVLAGSGRRGLAGRARRARAR